MRVVAVVMIETREEEEDEEEEERREGPHGSSPSPSGEKHPVPRKIAVSRSIADFDQTGRERERGGGETSKM